MENTISDRIFALIEALGYNKRSFSNELGLSNDVTIGRIVNEQREPSFKILSMIIQTFGNINANWLLTGEGEMLLDNKKNGNLNGNLNGNPNISNEEKNATVPFYNLPVSALEKINLNVGSAGHVDLPVFRGAECVLPVIGLNMEPVIYSGDLIGVKNVKPSNWDYLRTGEIYLVITHSEQLIAYVNDASNNKYIVCSRSNFAPFKINKSDILQLWRIVAIARGV